MTDLILTLSMTDLAALIAAGEVSSLELVEAYLSRIERHNPTLNVYLTVMADEAREQAAAADAARDAGADIGPLHGVSIAVKDLIDIAGQVTTAGSDFLRENIAARDAIVITRLKDAGAIIIGKTNLHEFAVGATTVNPHYGAARNPWNTDYSPGGSSGGSSAAMAARLAAGTLGSDTGGSVRMPASLCNLTGLRPAIGAIPLDGSIPMSWTLDTIGPIVQTVRDAARLYDVLANAETESNLDDRPDKLRIGVPDDPFFWDVCEPGVQSAFEAALDAMQSAGWSVVRFSLSSVKDALWAAGIISLGDAAAYHKERLDTDPARFGEDVRARLEWGAGKTAPQYALARHKARHWQQVIRDHLHDDCDIFALPTSPLASHKIAGGENLQAARDLLRFTYPISLTGLPALSVPCGFTSDGFPVGMQLVGLDVGSVLQVGHAYQQRTQWHQQTPSLA